MNVIEVKINNISYYFLASDVNVGLKVIVNTEKGLQLGEVININNENKMDSYEKIVRIATKSDIETYKNNLKLENIAIDKCKALITKYNLNMSILDAKYNFDRTQLIYRFISDERVDFRNLAKDLGAKLRTRIELRQIGVRDKAKEIGGIGPCGRMLCCNTFLKNFDTVSINMAKNQGLALNPSKINGVCGRLLCCLNYENELYSEIKKGQTSVKKKNNNNIEGTVIGTDIKKSNANISVNDEIIELEDNVNKR